MTTVEQHAELMARENLDDLSADDALLLIGELIDISHDLGSADGLTKAIALASELQRRPLDPEHNGRLHYFLGNAWFNRHRLVNQAPAWETPELERAILNFRTVLSKEEWIRALPTTRVCQISTNVANILSDTGRIVEAIELWEDALRLVPGYGMTIGSHGYGLFKYAFVVPDPGHARFLMSFARAHLTKAAALPLEHENARRFFIARLTEATTILAGMVTPDSHKLNSSSLGRSQRERQYRKWCLEHRLFLNPLNDLGEYSIGARDRIVLPSMVRPLNEGPIFQGLFNGSPKTGVGGIGADSAGPRGAATAKGQLRTDPRIPLPGRACGGLLRMSGAGSGGTAGVSTRYARPPLGSGPSDDTPAVPPLREQLWALRPGLDGGVPAVDDFTPGARGVVGAWA